VGKGVAEVVVGIAVDVVVCDVPELQLRTKINASMAIINVIGFIILYFLYFIPDLHLVFSINWSQLNNHKIQEKNITEV